MHLGAVNLCSMTTYKSRTDREIRQLAQDCVDGKIYGTWFGEESVNAFPAFNSPETVKRFQDTGVFHLFQYLAKALPDENNGIPLFQSYETLSRYDAARLEQAIHRLTRHKK